MVKERVDMTQITDIKLYNTQMSHSMKDKLFFLDYIKEGQFDTIIDFGCANGELLKQIPYHCDKIGIDNSLEMRKEAYVNYPECIYAESLDDLEGFDKSKTLLNMSSVIHEIYSYLSEEEVDYFWNQVFNGGYKYIIIRDMMVSNKTNRLIHLDDLRKITGAGYKSLFEDFRKVYPEWRVRDILHFFMKYRYTENWDRERDENYFPITKEELIALIPDTYEIIYNEDYVLEWTKDRVYQDFKYEIEDNTHTKLILKKKD